MNGELLEILNENPRYHEAYYVFLEFHKQRTNCTPKELEEFEKYYAADFLKGVKSGNVEGKVLIKGDRLTIREACIDDADFMRSVELDEDNSPWVADWPLGWRIAKFGDQDFCQTIIEREDGTPIGIIIFRDVTFVKERLQLKRIAIIDKGKGYGKEALRLAQKLAFEVLGTKYLYLGTKENNLRAQSIYKATGFVPDEPDPCTKFHMTDADYKKTDGEARRSSGASAEERFENENGKGCKE